MWLIHDVHLFMFNKSSVMICRAPCRRPPCNKAKNPRASNYMRYIGGSLVGLFLLGHFFSLVLNDVDIATLTCRDVETVFVLFFSRALFASSDYVRSLSHKMADDEHEAAAVQGDSHVADAANPHLPFKIGLPHPFSGDGTEPFSAWIERFEVALNVQPGLMFIRRY